MTGSHWGVGVGLLDTREISDVKRGQNHKAKAEAKDKVMNKKYQMMVDNIQANLHHYDQNEATQRLCSSSSTSLNVRRTRLSTVGDRAFPVTAAHLSNSLPSHVTAVPSLSIFCCRFKSHHISLSYPAF